MTDKPAPAEQVDRDAAADLYLKQHEPAWEHDYAKAAAIRAGNFNDYYVQAFARHRQPLAARVAELEAGLRMALAAIDDHNRTCWGKRDRIEDFLCPVPTGSTITSLSDARTLLEDKS